VPRPCFVRVGSWFRRVGNCFTLAGCRSLVIFKAAVFDESLPNLQSKNSWASCTSTATSASCPRVPRLLPFPRSSLKRSSMHFTLSISHQPRARIRPLSPLPARDPASPLTNSALCFHALTNCFFRNSFLFKIICVAPCFFPFDLQLSTVNRSIPAQLLYFHPTTNSLSLLQTSTPLQSGDYELFRQKKHIRGWRYEARTFNSSTFNFSTLSPRIAITAPLRSPLPMDAGSSGKSSAWLL